MKLSHTRVMENIPIHISDMNGIQLHSENIEGKSLHFQKKLHLSHLAKGIYFLAVRFDQDQCVRRLIIL